MENTMNDNSDLAELSVFTSGTKDNSFSACYQSTMNEKIIQLKKCNLKEHPSFNSKSPILRSDKKENISMIDCKNNKINQMIYDSDGSSEEETPKTKALKYLKRANLGSNDTDNKHSLNKTFESSKMIHLINRAENNAKNDPDNSKLDIKICKLSTQRKRSNSKSRRPNSKNRVNLSETKKKPSQVAEKATIEGRSCACAIF